MLKPTIIAFITSLFHLANSFSITMNSITPNQGIIFQENSQQKELGISVSGAGDVNGDGINDVIIGASGAKSGLGEAYVIYGSEENPPIIDLTTPLSLEKGFTITGGLAKAYLGSSVNTAGDINGDGLSDLVVAASAANLNTGVVYVIYGNKTQKSDVNLSEELDAKEGFVIYGTLPERLGSVVSCAGDVNGDGVSDIILGAPYNNDQSGTVYIIYGNKAGHKTIETSSLKQEEGFSINGLSPYSQFGKMVSGAGDVNGDGIDDIIIGVPYAESRAGKAFVVFGKKGTRESIYFDDEEMELNVGFTVTGLSYSSLGAAVSKAGDINGDGIDDIVIGCPKAGGTQGAVYVLFGRNDGGLRNINLMLDELTSERGFTISGKSTNYIGIAVSQAGDFNGDGIDDVFIGSPQMNSYQGIAQVFYGNKLGLEDVTLGSELDPMKWSYFQGDSRIRTIGYSISGIGDFNKDGIDDVIIGSRDAYVGRGAAFIIFGENGCPKYCKTCINETVCLSCFLDYGVYNKTCQICPEGMEVSSKGGICVIPEEVPEENIKDEEESKLDCPMGCLNCTADKVCQVCDEDYILLNPATCVLKGVITQANFTSALLDGSSIVGNSLCVGSSLPTNLGFAAKMVKNTRYLNVPVSNTLQSTFHAWKTRSDFLNAPQSWSEKSKNNSDNLPRTFERYHVESGFLINYWRSLVMILISVGVFALFKVLELVYLNNQSQKQTIWYSSIRTVKIAASNFAVAQFYGSFDEIIFFFVLEVRAKRSSDAFTSFSLLFGILFFLLMIGAASAHIFLIIKYQRRVQRIGDNNQQANLFGVKYENIKIIYADFHNNSLPQQIFLLVNAARSVLASLFMVTLFDYPLAQTVILTVLSLLILAYLSIFKPFRRSLNSYAQYFCEIILLIVNICMLILVCIDKSGAQAENAVEKLSTALIVLNMIMMIGSSIFILAMISLMLYGAYQERRLRIKSVTPISKASVQTKSAFGIRQEIYKEKESISDQDQENSKSESINFPLNSHQQGSSNEILEISKIHQTLETSSIQTDRPLIQNLATATINSGEEEKQTPGVLAELDLGKSNFSN